MSAKAVAAMQLVAARIPRARALEGLRPLHLGKLWKYAGGRSNRLGEYACLYTVLTRAGGLAELERARARFGATVGPQDLVSIDVTLGPGIDLTNPEELGRAQASAGLPPEREQLVTDGPEAMEHCPPLADWARGAGCTGLLVPSAAAPGETNLIIFFDVVAPKTSGVDDGPEREPAPD